MAFEDGSKITKNVSKQKFSTLGKFRNKNLIFKITFPAVTVVGDLTGDKLTLPYFYFYEEYEINFTPERLEEIRRFKIFLNLIFV